MQECNKTDRIFHRRIEPLDCFVSTFEPNTTLLQQQQEVYRNFYNAFVRVISEYRTEELYRMAFDNLEKNKLTEKLV